MRARWIIIRLHTRLIVVSGKGSIRSTKNSAMTQEMYIFGLSTNRMNPFNERMSDHNTWLVILTMYNIPTWLCQKRKYLLLTILISGPKQLGIDIDVFLEPLMQEIERPWRHGELMYDAFRKEDFICRVIIFVTINDYPAVFALSG